MVVQDVLDFVDQTCDRKKEADDDAIHVFACLVGRLRAKVLEDLGARGMLA